MCKEIQILMALVLILASLQTINAYKYLFVSPIPGKSHAILGDAMVEHLVEAGHEVTYITSVVPEKVPPRVTIVDTSDHHKLFPLDSAFITAIMDKKISGIDIKGFVPSMMRTSRATLENQNVQKLLADKNQTFDAVIAEWMYNEVYAGFAGVYDCPLIWFSTLEPQWMLLQTVDEMPNPAYSTDMFSKTIPPFTFVQRIRELLIKIEGKLLQTFTLDGLEQEIYEKYYVPIFRDRRNSVPTWSSLKYNASLILHNSHVSMGSPPRLPLNVVSVGGFYIKPEVPPLPEDLQKFMDNAKHGVIYFSLGSNIKSVNLPDHVRKAILRTLGRYNQTVIWKFEENLPGAPKNVHIVQWAPQQSILAHKNCILFITHGGLLSTTEALHFGVPMIGIPVFGDQFVNVERVVQKGFGLKVDLSYALGEDLDEAIGKIVNNPKYATRVKELSEIYHDRPLPPSKELIHWVEHVVRTKGAPHLRSPAIVVPWYQKLYLDLVALILVIILVLKYVLNSFKSILIIKIKQKQT